MSRIRFIILSFIDFVVVVVGTLISPENQRKCMCDFFDKGGYPACVAQVVQHRTKQIDRQSALQTSQKEYHDGIPFTLATAQ